jgi:hypothetical protein
MTVLAYAQAAAQALPHADQVADRWHLMVNASHAELVQGSNFNV